jgi:hypothetical protein
MFGVEEYYRHDTNVQAKGNGTHDIFAFELDPENAGRDGGIRHRSADPLRTSGIMGSRSGANTSPSGTAQPSMISCIRSSSRLK